MLFTNIYKNVCRSRICQLSNVIKIKENRLKKYQRLNEEPRLLKTPISLNNVPRRFFINESSSDNQEQDLPRLQLPALTDDPLILTPSFFFTFSNFMYTYGIKLHLDRDFDLPEFIEASKQAVEVISNALAVEDYDSLQGLVTNDVIDKLKERLTRFSKAQKELISISKDDIFVQFPYEVSVDKKLVEGQSRQFVEITMVYYSFRDLKNNKDVNTLEQAQIIGSHPEQIFISNYRFRRDYTDCNEPSSWIVTKLNEFMFITSIMFQKLYRSTKRFF